MNKLYFIAMALLLSVGGNRAFAQAQKSCANTHDVSGCSRNTLLQDTTIVYGKLPNGLTYYLRPNKTPARRASYYIVRNVGALMESDHENGLAHFLEHMAFNGTRHFKGKAMLNTLQRHGVVFGRDLNAYTGQNETVYNLSNVSTADEALIDTCLLVLHDWSHYLTLSSREIEAERGVIAEEWRTRRTPQFRLQLQTWPVLYKDSKYAERDVIGSLDVIKGFTPATLRNFYHRWYRSDLEAIVVVGDFDVRQMEQKVVKLFSGLPAVKNAEPRPSFLIPHQPHRRYVLATDKEITRSSVSLTIRLPRPEKHDTTPEAYIRHHLVTSLFNTMMKARIDELKMQPETPFTGGSISLTPLVRGYDMYTVNANCQPADEARAFEAIMTENQRMLKYGFTESELNRNKAKMLEDLETVYKRKGRKSNDAWAKELQAHYLDGKPLLGYEQYYRTACQVLQSVTMELLMSEVRGWNTDANSVAVVTGPASGCKHLTQEEAFDIIDSVRGKDYPLPPYIDKGIGGALITDSLAGGKIISEKSLPQFKAKEWTLSNGARVVFRESHAEASVMLSSHSWGGTSLYDTDMLPAAENAASMVGSFGLGNLKPADLQRMLTGRNVKMSASISELSESLGGAAMPQDVEVMMQMLYLTFERPRFDGQLFNAIMRHNHRNLKQTAGKPFQIMQDSMLLITSAHHPRSLLFDAGYLDCITLDKLKRVYTERICDASDFTFFIVGNISESRIRPLVEKYIGSLTSIHRKESWRDNKMRGAQGKVKRRIDLPLEVPKATVIVGFSKGMEYTPYHNVMNSVLQLILQARYLESIREKEGGTYGVTVSAGATRIPRSCYTMNVQFECQPERAEKLNSLVYAELEKLMRQGPSEEELATVVKQLLQTDSETCRSNGYILSAIANYYIDGIDLTDKANFADILDRIRPDDVRKYVKKLYKKCDVVDVIFR